MSRQDPQYIHQEVRRKKAEGVHLFKPTYLSIDTMSSRLNILNNYLASFPSTDNKPFSKGQMIEIVLSMLPAVWINSMITASLGSRKKSYEGFIEHLEKLKSSLPDEPIPKKEEIKDAPDTTSILKKEKRLKT